MARKSSNPVEDALGAYNANIKKLISHLSTYDNPEQHGFFSSIVAKVNKRLSEYGLDMPEQYPSDWYKGRKAKTRGLDIPSAVKLGYGAGLHSDPTVACGLVYLALMGVWDPAEETADALLARIRNRNSSKQEDRPVYDSSQLDRIENKIDTLTKVYNPALFA